MVLNDWWNSKRGMMQSKEQIRELLCVGAFRRRLVRKRQRRKKSMFLSSRQKLRRTWMMKISKAFRHSARASVIFRCWWDIRSWWRSESKKLPRSLGRHRQTNGVPLWGWEDGKVCLMLLSKFLDSPLSDKSLKMKCIEIASQLQPSPFATILLVCYRFVATFTRVLCGSHA